MMFKICLNFFMTPLRLGNFCRKYSSTTKFNVESLKKRTILRLSGPETTNYLQSMVTNDVKRVEETSVFYSLLLNPNGRVLYDTILYKMSPDEYLVEYDCTGVEYLHRHLLMYRLRKNVKIQPLTDMAVWVLYKESLNKPEETYLSNIKHHLKCYPDIIAVEEDPRNKILGIRVITNKNANLYEILEQGGFNASKTNTYTILRYKLGIGEGVLDHPPGNCLPFETNVDLLGGVSFSKGCYIGQEMAAKSNFVLSIRKRLMPILLDDITPYPAFPPECAIINEKDKKVGRLRCHIEKYGLALLKFEESLNSECLKLQNFDVKLKTSRPTWWPKNLSSDKNEHIHQI